MPCGLSFAQRVRVRFQLTLVMATHLTARVAPVAAFVVTTHLMARGAPVVRFSTEGNLLVEIGRE